MKKVSVGTTIAVAALTAAVTVSLTYLYAMDRFNTKVADVNERQAMYTKLNEIDQKVRRDAVGELDETAIKDGICAGYVAGLGDANAKYLSAEKYRIYLQGDAEKSIGPGIRTLQDEDGNMEVIEVLAGSAAEAAGMKKGDVIIAIDDKEVVRLTYGEALTHLDGAEGSQVSFRVLRETEVPQEDEEGNQTGVETKTEVLDFQITRREYTASSVYWEITNGNVAHIVVRNFTDSTEEEMEKAITQLQEKEISGIVLDLRGCASGTTENMVSAAKWFLPAGNAARYVDSSGETVVEYTAGSQRLGLPLAVLIDDTSYGAAEILAADIRDGKSGTVVGCTTGGGASRQETIQLSDGSALILTVGYYVDAQGNSMYGQGVAPDREVTLTEKEKWQLLRGILPAEEDPQLQTAVTTLIENGAAVSQVPGVVYEEETSSQSEESSSSAEPSQSPETEESSKSESSSSQE